MLNPFSIALPRTHSLGSSSTIIHQHRSIFGIVFHQPPPTPPTIYTIDPQFEHTQTAVAIYALTSIKLITPPKPKVFQSASQPIHYHRLEGCRNVYPSLFSQNSTEHCAAPPLHLHRLLQQHHASVDNKLIFVVLNERNKI